jgi:hypothetical protein
VDTTKPAIAARLVWAARRAGVRLRFAGEAVLAGDEVGRWRADSACGNPDLVLAEAVTAGVLSRQEAELIGATRLERAPIGRLAATAGVRANSRTAVAIGVAPAPLPARPKGHHGIEDEGANAAVPDHVERIRQVRVIAPAGWRV